MPTTLSSSSTINSTVESVFAAPLLPQPTISPQPTLLSQPRTASEVPHSLHLQLQIPAPTNASLLHALPVMDEIRPSSQISNGNDDENVNLVIEDSEPTSEALPPDDYLCHDCAEIDFSKVFQKRIWDEVGKDCRGIVLQKFAERPDGGTFRDRACWLCEHLSSEMIESDDNIKELVAWDRWKLCQDALSQPGDPWEWAPTLWEAADRAGPPRVLYITPRPFKEEYHMFNQYLVFQRNLSSAGILEPTQPPPYVDLSVARLWIAACEAHHPGCSQPSLTPRIRLIDCATKDYEIVDADPSMKYVALSYVWGRPTQLSAWQNKLAVGTLPNTIRDAISVTEGLGYRYLWIDRYCIKQDQEADKLDQIQLMDAIYQRAALTIIAAAGRSDGHGIPGVQAARRQRERWSWGNGDFTFSKPIRPKTELTDTYWFLRGWTFQEGVLSRRRLVFTEDFMYFECLSTIADDSMGSCEHIQSKKEMEEYDMVVPKLDNAACFGRLPEGNARQHLRNYHGHLTKYTERSLSYPSDVFNAFSGVSKMFERSSHPITTVYGIPFVVGDEQLPPDMAFSTSLCWFKDPMSQPREDSDAYAALAPSWSWAKVMSLIAYWDFNYIPLMLHPSNIRLQAENTGTLLTLSEYGSAKRQNPTETEPRTLLLDACLLSEEVFLRITGSLGADVIRLHPDEQSLIPDYDPLDEPPVSPEHINHIAEKVSSGKLGLLLLGMQWHRTSTNRTRHWIHILLIGWAANRYAFRVGLMHVRLPYDDLIFKGLLEELGATRTCVRLC